jgi:hypothetical protein
MQLLPEETRWWLEALLYAALAALGGLLGHIMRAIDKQEKINVARAIIEAMAAGFVGLLMMLACNAMALPSQWTGVIVGVCGWLGANATIRILEELVYKKLGLKKARKAQ